MVEVVNVDARFGVEFEGKYVFGEITWAKRSRIIQKHTKYHPVSGQVVNSDFIAIQAESIWACLKEQPPGKPITLEKLLSDDVGVPIGLGELFSRVVNKLCGPSKEETAFLSAPSDVKNLIPSLQTSDCAKNSAGLQPSSPSSLPG
jgi:hypothetical protein